MAWNPQYAPLPVERGAHRWFTWLAVMRILAAEEDITAEARQHHFEFIKGAGYV